MRGLLKGLFILLAVGLAFCIPLFILFFFRVRVEHRAEYRDQAIVQHSTPVGGIHPVDLSGNAGYPGQEQMIRQPQAEMPELVQINGAGSVTVINPGLQPGWQPGQVVVQTPGAPPFTHVPSSSPVRWVLTTLLFLGVLGGMFVALLIRVARGATRPEGRGGMDPEIDMLALRIHEKEEQLMRRLEALETLLVGELGRGNETRRG
jgi:hypothetical protein